MTSVEGFERLDAATREFSLRMEVLRLGFLLRARDAELGAAERTVRVAQGRFDVFEAFLGPLFYDGLVGLADELSR